MRRVEVVVDKWLRVDARNIGYDLADDIIDQLRVPNLARAEALEQGRFWQAKDMPESYLLARYRMNRDNDDYDSNWFYMARGYALELKRLLRRHGLKVRWIDQRTWQQGEPYGRNEFVFKEHQAPAVDEIKRHQQGMYRAPTGSGKTVVVCGLLWDLHPRAALILVDRISLVDQWVRNLRDHIGVAAEDIGRIGEGQWSEGRITVATVQTLWQKRHAKKVERLLKRVSVMVLDECHHATADAYRAIVDSCYARIRIGVSATPAKSPSFELAKHTLGPIFHYDTDEDMRAAGVIMKPTVEVIHTPFQHVFWGNHAARRDPITGEVDECDVPGCKKSGKVPHKHQSNYQAVKKALLNDPERNQIIARMIEANLDHSQLVISNEVNQLDTIWKTMHEMGIGNGSVECFTITGRVKGKERAELFERIERAKAPLIFSTVAGEGLDIPRIDRIHLPFPEGNPESTQQKIGRGTRMWEGKTDIVVYDYADVAVPPFAKQFRSRRWKCYSKLDLEVVINEDYT